MHRNVTEEFHGFPIWNQSKPKPQNLVTWNITNKMLYCSEKMNFTMYTFRCWVISTVASVDEPEDWRVPNMWFHPLHPPGFWGCWIWTVDGIHSPSCRKSGCCTDVAPTPEEEAHSAGKTGKHGSHTTLEGQSPNWGCTKMYSPTCMSYAILKCTSSFEGSWNDMSPIAEDCARRLCLEKYCRVVISCTRPRKCHWASSETNSPMLWIQVIYDALE